MESRLINDGSGKRLVVLVTGCSNQGIGSFLAKNFAISNCNTYASARNIDSLRDLDEYGCHKLEIDVSNMDSIKKAVSHIMRVEGRIDILINNAGINLVGPVVELDITKASQVFDTNVLGVLRVTQAVAPFMIGLGSGTIVNVGSIAGDMCMPWAGIYSASKAALHSMTDALRLELRPFNIDVVSVKPGAVKSNIASNNLAFQGATCPEERNGPFLNKNLFTRKLKVLYSVELMLPKVFVLFDHFSTFFKEKDSYDTDLFSQKVVSWVLNRRNKTLVKLGFWLSPTNVVLGALTWGIGRVSPQLAPSMSYFSGYTWTLPTEFVLGGKTWSHTLNRFVPRFVSDAILWSKFGLGTLAVSTQNNQDQRQDEQE